MLDNMFSLFFGLSCETKILEACEWDEERAEEVANIFSEFILSCSKLGISKKDTISKKLNKDWGSNLSDTECKSLLEIVDMCLESAPILLNADKEYVN